MTFMSDDGVCEFGNYDDCKWYEESCMYFDKKYYATKFEIDQRIVLFREDKSQHWYNDFIDEGVVFTEHPYVCIMNKQNFRELESLINRWEDRVPEPFPYSFLQKDPKHATDEEVEDFINNMLVYDKNTKQWTKTNLTLEEGMNKYGLNTEYYNYEKEFNNIDLEELKNYIE